MTANLENLTPENYRVILDITAIGQQMGLDSVVIDAAINIANAESSLRSDPPPTGVSSAWGTFQYLDDSWATSWNRLIQTQAAHGITIPDGLTAADTRFSYQWQIIVALNDLRSYYVGYPSQIASAWQDDVASLVDRGFSPDSIFLQYAYLRHNTDSAVGGQVETVYTRDFTELTVAQANALSAGARFVSSALSGGEDFAVTDFRLVGDGEGGWIVEIDYMGGSSELRVNGVAPDSVQFDPRTGEFTAVYPDGTAKDFIAVGGEIRERQECFLAGTAITLSDSAIKPIESIFPGDVVQSYDATGALVPGRVTRTFRNEVSHLLDVHGLKVTPGHVTLCGDGMFKGRHVPIIDILVSDGALVQADGTLIRMAINAPVGSVADAFVKVAVALTPEDMQADRLTEAEMRVGTLLFDREGTPVSVLDCLTAEGYAFDPATGLIAKPGEAPHPLFWFGRLPRPEDYILNRSQETLEGILTDGEWEGSRPQLIEGRLRQSKMMRLN